MNTLPHAPAGALASQPARPAWLGYAVALVANAAAFLVAWLLEPHIAPLHTLVFVLAVIVTVYVGGLGSALVANLVATALIAVVFFEPVGRPRVALPLEQTALALFWMLGLPVTILAEAHRRAEDHQARVTNQLRSLAEASLAITASLTLDDVLRTTTDHARHIIGAHQAYAGLTPGRGWANAHTAASFSNRYANHRASYTLPAEGGILAVVSESNRALRLTAAQLETHSQHPARPAQRAQPPLHGLLAAPLLDPHGRNLGVLALSDKTAGEFTASDEALLVQLAHVASVAVQNARLYQAERAARLEAELVQARLRLLNELSVHLEAAIDPGAVLSQAAALMVPALADYCLIDLADPQAPGGIRRLAAQHREPARQSLLDELAAHQPAWPASPAPVEQVLRTGRPFQATLLDPLALSSLAASARHLGVLQRLAPRSVLCLPLAVRGRTLGALTLVMAESGRRYSLADRQLAEEVARRAAAAADGARLYADLQQANLQLEARVVERTAELEHEVTERRQAETLIRLSERQLAQAQEIAQMGSWTWRPAAGRVECSAELLRILGYPLEPRELAFEQFLAAIHPDDQLLVQRTIAGAIDQRQSFSSTHRVVRPDGQVRVVFFQGEPLAGDASAAAALTGVAQDLTERHQIEAELRRSREQLRHLSRYLQRARDAEQSRVARGIHDELGGSLSAIKMAASQARNRLEADDTPGALRRLANVFDLVDATINAVRRMATDLHPPLLDDFGLLAAVEWQLQEFHRQTGIEARLSSTPAVAEQALERELANTLFRVFQEALTNVARHSHATLVEVSLTVTGGHVQLVLADNGRGIAPHEAHGLNSLGLLGMRERVRLLAGALEVSGAPGQGTRVVARLPLVRPPAPLAPALPQPREQIRRK